MVCIVSEVRNGFHYIVWKRKCWTAFPLELWNCTTACLNALGCKLDQSCRILRCCCIWNIKANRMCSAVSKLGSVHTPSFFCDHFQSTVEWGTTMRRNHPYFKTTFFWNSFLQISMWINSWSRTHSCFKTSFVLFLEWFHCADVTVCCLLKSQTHLKWTYFISFCSSVVFIDVKIFTITWNDRCKDWLNEMNEYQS